MRRIDLSGEWSVHKAGSKKSIPAQVPGCVHADLLASLEIENPFPRRNLESVAWVASCEWVYEKLFVSEDFSAFDSVVLRFDGLDTCASISLNDTVLGKNSDAFEAVEFEVKSLVKAGKNRLTVTFVPAGRDGVCDGGAVRCLPSASAGGGRPASPTAGIWRGVSVLAFSSVRVKDVLIRQDFSAGGVVGLDVSVLAERYHPDQHLEVLVRVCYKGNILHEARDILAKDQTTLHLNIKNPQLWWPAGMGEQPLYEVTVDVLAGRTCHEHVSRRIGLRQFRLEAGEANGRKSRRFFINGHAIFLKGASWLPADLYVARLTRVEYARLVKAAAVANMNCLRVWGGGVYESDAFYDLCDEYGICVWQDMMHADVSPAIPADVALAAFEREVRCAVQRVRHHPCVVMWCGGDGDGTGSDAAYARQAAALAQSLDPDRPYLPPTPHVPFSLGMSVPEYRTLPSYPEPRIVAGYLNEEERNVSHPACLFHVAPGDGAKRIYDAFLDQFLLPSGFENVLWLSQIQQGLAVKSQITQVRTDDAAAAGFMFWHFNDCWPGCSPSSVDFEGRWKALHYMARRFFASLTLFGRYRVDTGTVDVFAVNDGVKPFKGEIQWRVTQMEGSVLAEGTKKVSLSPASQEKPTTVKVADALRKVGASNLLMWLYLLDEQGNQLAWNIVPFCAWRELTSLPPRMRAEIRNWDDNSFAVTLTSHHPALWVWISLEGLDARYDDNFFCLEPEKPFRVRITPSSRIKLDQFRQLIRIGSLRDTWQEKRNLMQMMAAAKK
ncbi:MAG TPA: glycoside hydrolase family 2 TIM barrel-domain containing protein [Kiritimatiellia bacterium]|nr:glycoside hydrolase family 2 TIM barrel-domain containing protein [Kiritimatiellia bacterium]HPS07870.1 glycoside hydrolase family 2 TIM barrel-domain containing protein [Kiritimatiellia bacterium]